MNFLSLFHPSYPNNVSTHTVPDVSRPLDPLPLPLSLVPEGSLQNASTSTSHCPAPATGTVQRSHNYLRLALPLSHSKFPTTITTTFLFFIHSKNLFPTHGYCHPKPSLYCCCTQLHSFFIQTTARTASFTRFSSTLFVNSRARIRHTEQPAVTTTTTHIEVPLRAQFL